MTQKPNTATTAGVVKTIIAAIGVPLAAWQLGPKWQSLGKYAKYRWLVFVVYEIVVFVWSFVADVWKKVRSDLIDYFAIRLKFAAQVRFSRFERRYRRQVYNHCRYLDLKGLTIQGIYPLEMERVFIQLSVTPDRPHRDAQGPVPAQARAETIAERRDVREYLERPGHFAIIGAPGSGKTTLLRHVAINLASTRFKKVKQTLPVLLYLGSHAKAIVENKDVSLEEVILESEILKELTIKPPQSWFEDRLGHGKCLILLDGLDELGDSGTRTKMAAWVEKCLHAYPDNRFFITSRPLGYMENPVQGVTTLRVLPFTLDEVDHFVSSWYLANEVMSHNREDEGVRSQARKGAADLMRGIRRSDSLKDLAQNPLLLTMIAIVHRFGGGLPGGRVTLYHEIFEVFLGKHRLVAGARDDFKTGQERFVLGALAYKLMCTGAKNISAGDAAAAIGAPLESVDPTIKPKAFLQMMESSSGLLLERENGIYSFAHDTFQEYLAAAHIRSNNLDRDLISRITDTQWEETILWYVAEADATPIVEACLRQMQPSMATLTLAIRCLQEAQRVDQVWREKIGNVVENADREHQRIYGEAMLGIRRKRILGEADAVDATFVTNAEYQVFLDQPGIDCAPDHWTDACFLKGEGSQPAAILRYSHVKRFCQWMTEKYGGTSWEYAAPFSAQLQAAQLSDPKQQEVQDVMGCWSREGQVVGGSERLLKLRVVAEESLQLVIGAVKASYRATAAGLARSIVRASILASELARAPGVSPDVVGALVCELDLSLSSARGLARDYDLASGLDPGPYFRDLDPEARELELSLARARALAVVASIQDLNLVRDIAGQLNSAHELAGKIAGGLGGDRNAQLDLARDALDLARKLSGSLNLDSEQAGSPDLARDLAVRTDFDLLFLERPSKAVRQALLNEVRAGTAVGGIRLARTRAASPAAGPSPAFLSRLKLRMRRVINVSGGVFTTVWSFLSRLTLKGGA
jgi:hypothetical protein